MTFQISAPVISPLQDQDTVHVDANLRKTLLILRKIKSFFKEITFKSSLKVSQNGLVLKNKIFFNKKVKLIL